MWIKFRGNYYNADNIREITYDKDDDCTEVYFGQGTTINIRGDVRNNIISQLISNNKILEV